jgi:hypothetical protein
MPPSLNTPVLRRVVHYATHSPRVHVEGLEHGTKASSTKLSAQLLLPIIT